MSDPVTEWTGLALLDPIFDARDMRDRYNRALSEWINQRKKSS